MVRQVTSFKTTTGKSFDTEFEAWGEEFRDFLVTNGADNDAIARKIVAAIVDGQPETLCTLADIVENMHRCAPHVVLPDFPPTTIEYLSEREVSHILKTVICTGCGTPRIEGQYCTVEDCPGF